MENLSQQFYNLNTDPFRLFPDHRFSFFHRTYKNAFDDLQRGLDAGDGFIVITGRAGTGKTTLINETIAKLDTNKAVVATLVTTQYEAHDLLGMIASSFGLNCHKKSKSIIWLELEKFLWMRRSKGKRALLVVDEAQGLGADALEELQALSNLQDNGKPLLQIILIGREELIDLINSPELENLRKRIISSSRLEPLSESETIDYLTHRLDHAGWTGDPEITKGTGFLAHHFSGGIPSTINLVFNRLLLHGSFVEKHELNADDMKSVLEELSEERLISEKYAVTSDIEERVNILENEHIQPLNRIKNTSEPAEYPGDFNYPESTIQTDESTDKASVDNNSRVDTHDSNDESGVHTEATVFDSKTIQVPD
jgi:type II secretory pathway predicted ATPase ExeA